tara:strand:- start:1065 stop:2390 length:1326 start_codon:yes stop_codon:yes gene_type:complete
MSRRRLEQGASGASSFSLRALQTTPADAVAASAGAMRRPAGPFGAPPAVPTQATTLNFRFSTLTGAVPQAPKPVEAPKLPSNFFSRPVSGAAAQGTGDVLRLTAVVDDLTQRLRKTTEVKNQLEGQVQRINAALVQERSNATARIQSLKAEVGAVQESEHRLRSELATRPAVKEVDTNRFQASVRSALEQEETNARVADAEARVSMLGKRYDALTAEVKVLDERRGAGLAAQSLTSEEVEAMVAKAAEAQAKMTRLEEHQAVVQDSITHLEAVRSSHHKEAQETETKLLQANEATAASVADASAAKEQVQSLRLEHGDIATKIAAMKQKLVDMNLMGAQPVTEVSGAAAPRGLLGEIKMGPVTQVDTMSCCHTGVGYHFAHDCPIGITLMPTDAAGGMEEEATQAMISAIVNDLKAKFTFDAQEHDKIGAPSATATIEAAA